MERISLLSKDTIDKIAAGEVVERPASVVKELVENAVDAGANAVTVEIKDGGISLIRITDNGCGIPKDQVQSAFLRHATSKIRTADDLLTTGTLGFRGEALSSIAAVCQVEMITKTPGSLLGVRYVIEGGVEMSLEEIGAPEGTTLLVRNLFYHTPARRKFLKSSTTEAGYVSDLMERLALSHPNIAFKFINNQDTKLHTSGNGKLKDIIYGIYGREITSNVVWIDTAADHPANVSTYTSHPTDRRRNITREKLAEENDSEGKDVNESSSDTSEPVLQTVANGKGNPLRISGYIGKPAISRGNRNYENYFVNGRYVRSAIIARAIEDAYKPFMMSHRYPLTILMLDIDKTQVDINVHPTKMEVRFADQSFIYDQVYNAVKEGLVHKELIPEFTVETKRKSAVSQSHPEEKDGTAGNQVLSNGDSTSSSNTQKVADRHYRYPEPFEKVRSQLLAESKSPYEPKYPNHQVSASSRRSDLSNWQERVAESLSNCEDDVFAKSEKKTGTLKPVTGVITNASPGESSENEKPGILAASEANMKENRAVTPSSGREIWPEVTDSDSEKKIAIVSDGLIPAESSAGQAESRTEPLLSQTYMHTEQSDRQEYPDTDQKPVQMELFDDRLLSEQNVKQHKLIGQVFDTYWIVEFQDKMYIIDQHAAHEKVLYERFMKNLAEKKQTSQMITPPIIVSFSMQEEELLKKYMDRFTEVGFEIEPFGGREYSIRAVPGNLYNITSEELFIEMLDGLTDVSERASDQIIRERIASMSCKAAVKGNHRLSVAEVDALIGELLTLDNPYNCPHGRPTIIAMSKYELEKKFKRVV
ncbi:MAG: DNA mismatch repair endonuclease MutL [Lachnospiraceae bacterium]|nr:DNA mismatch repair endonuclease MutL [Lachnospiraceae bacterium]